MNSLILKKECVVIPLQAETASEAIGTLLKACEANGLVTDPEDLLMNMMERETTRHTVCFSGIAIPRGCSTGVKEPFLAIGRLDKPIPWMTEEVSLIVMFAVPFPKDSAIVLQILMDVAKCLKTPEKRELLKSSLSSVDLWDIWTDR